MCKRADECFRALVDADVLLLLIRMVLPPPRAGHVDFSYEVSRSLRACQGALFLVDASQGVQAQTVANHNAARDAGLVIVPCLTKIDLAVADPEPCLAQMSTLFGACGDVCACAAPKRACAGRRRWVVTRHQPQ